VEGPNGDYYEITIFLNSVDSTKYKSNFRQNFNFTVKDGKMFQYRYYNSGNQNQINELNTEIDTLNTEIAELYEKLSALDPEDTDYQTDYDDLSEQMQEKQDQRSTKYSQLSKLYAQNGYVNIEYTKK
jgi:chromosome segregation ATPase